MLEDDTINTSDHNPVFINLEMQTIPILTSELQKLKVLKWSEIRSEIIADKNTKLVSQRINALLDKCTSIEPDSNVIYIDNMFESLIEILHTASGLPRSRFKRHLKPYWCHEMNILKREKVDAGRPRNSDNATRIEYLRCKRTFNYRLYVLAREYGNESLKQTMASAEINSSEFWKMIKRHRGANINKIYAVQNNEGKIVHELSDVLEVWRHHFSSLCTPTDDPAFDNDHFNVVNSEVDK